MNKISKSILSKISIAIVVLSMAFSQSYITTLAASDDTTVYITKTGKCYHNADCSYLKSSIAVSLKDAADNYSACSRCKPPTLDKKDNEGTTKAKVTDSVSKKSDKSTSKKETAKAATAISSKKSTTKASTESKTEKESTKSTATVEAVEKTVWLSATGTKYHSKNNCGSMNPKKATKMSEEDAIAAGRSACSKCMK